MAIVREDLMLTKAQIGNTIIASVAITVLFRLLSGPLCDRFGARAVKAAGIEWDSEQAHSAVYDTERTADLFCTIVNRWTELLGEPVLTCID